MLSRAISTFSVTDTWIVFRVFVIAGAPGTLRIVRAISLQVVKLLAFKTPQRGGNIFVHLDMAITDVNAIFQCFFKSFFVSEC